MDLNTQIKKYRTDLKLSQEELAEKVYVTRQTISNWENGKSYPDIHSLLLLSSLFNVTLDKLIKGDIEIMKEKINQSEINKLNKYGTIYSILLTATILSIVPVIIWHNIYIITSAIILYVITMYFALKVEHIKKDNNIYTYKEIVAFTEGKRLDEIQKQQEIGKKPYQIFLLTIGCAVIVLVIGLLTTWFVSL